MPHQPLLHSVLVLLFHAGISCAGISQHTSPSGIRLAIVSGTCSYGAERGPWHCETAGAAPQTLGTTRHGSGNRGGQHTSGEGVDRLGEWGLAACLTCLTVSLWVDVTCTVGVVRAG